MASSTNQNVTLPVIPELFEPGFLDLLLPPVAGDVEFEMVVDPAPSNPMMDALTKSAQRDRTANGAEAFSTTDSATLDAFIGIYPEMPRSNLETLLADSWKEDPTATLRLIWQLRSIHHGKSDKELFYRAFGWLYNHHPRTAIANLPALVQPLCPRPQVPDGSQPHGYWKDLLNILVLATLNQLTPPSTAHYLHSRPAWHHTPSKAKLSKATTPEEREQRIRAAAQRNDMNKAAARVARTAALADSHAQLRLKLQDAKYRALYITVTRLFAEQLILDIRVLKEISALAPGADARPLYKKISLAGKWAPTPALSHDRHTNISTAIIRVLYHNRDQFPSVFPSALTADSIDKPSQLHILRSFCQRWILTPLRAAIRVPESYMSTSRWNQVQYQRVPSICMKNNAESFYKHDEARFVEFIQKVEKGEANISGATLLPHVLVAQAVASERAQADEGSGKVKKNAYVKEILGKMKAKVADAQWKTLIARLQESGNLDNSIAICDVSGSMGSIECANPKSPEPILPAIALSLVVAQLAKPPFNNAYITFSEDPEFRRIKSGATLHDMVMDLSRANWGMNTDFDKVFLQLLLPLAVQNKIKPEDMIKRLFVFSDMQFDESTQGVANRDGAWETNHDRIELQFREAGYEMPEIVYWNLQGAGGYTRVQVQKDRKGVAMMSGFSSSMLKDFMGDDLDEDWNEIEADDEEDGKADVVRSVQVKNRLTPLELMHKTLSKSSFSTLVVYD